MVSGISAACCSLPAVITHNYTARGNYVDIAGLKTYVTGPTTAQYGILAIYDIFGYFPQTLQGVDKLAFGEWKNDVGQAQQEYFIVMPDFFEGKPAKLEWIPPGDDKEKLDGLNEIFSRGNPERTLGRIDKIMQELTTNGVTVKGEIRYPVLQKWSVMGYCWGGKIANLCASPTSDGRIWFESSVMLHPARLDSEDGANARIPVLMLPSKDEDAHVWKAWAKAVKNPRSKVDESFLSCQHGFAAARANLDNEGEKEAYVNAYKVVSRWLQEQWSTT